MLGVILFALFLFAPTLAGVVKHDIQEQEAPDDFVAEIQHITYYLYTKSTEYNPVIINDGDIRQLRSASSYDARRPNLFIIHGWVDDYQSNLNDMVKTATFKRHDFNIFVVDWSPFSMGTYTKAVDSVPSVGRLIGEFINEIMSSYNLDGSSFIIVGHSLGAHISGSAGKVTRRPIKQIIGLDPAGPLFSLSNTQNRLDAADAEYVQVIHTNTRLLGFTDPIGDVDYYPNGGQVQNGCGLDLLGTCSHQRAYEYLTEAIESNTPFVATKCGSYSDFTGNRCNSNQRTAMGSLEVDQSVRGVFYLSTNTKSLYALL